MAGHKLSNFIGTKESFYIGKRLTPTGVVKNSNTAATFHCFETPIWWTCLVKTPYTYTFTSLVCHGVGQGGSLTTRALEVEFFGLAAHLQRHQLRRLQQPRLARVCIFAGPRKRMYESGLKIIPIDISFVWC